jgi:acetyl esterase/lipase
MHAEAPSPLTWEQLDAMPLPPAVVRTAYGIAPQQFGELRLPEGSGPHPVVVLIHGGCWRNRFDLAYITRLAAWLTAHGWATWTIEYRRLGDEGGGWPGTLLDAATALDALRELAVTAPLDLQRVVTSGHSAGGHLALWLASRALLRPDSPLYVPDPLPVSGVLGLAAITDLDQYRIGPPESCHAAVDLLLGGSPADVPQRYADASPLRRLPMGVRQAFLHGDLDDTVSVESVRHYVQVARAAGDAAQLLELSGAGHFDVTVATPVSAPVLLEGLDWLSQ